PARKADSLCLTRTYSRERNPRTTACAWWEIRAVVRTKFARNAGKRADDKAYPLLSRRDVPRRGCTQDRECASRIDIHRAAGKAIRGAPASIKNWRCRAEANAIVDVHRPPKGKASEIRLTPRWSLRARRNGGRGGIRTHGGFPHARFRVECLKPDSATLPLRKRTSNPPTPKASAWQTLNVQHQTSNASITQISCLRGGRAC